jgi:hypothetical protein
MYYSSATSFLSQFPAITLLLFSFVHMIGSEIREMCTQGYETAYCTETSITRVHKIGYGSVISVHDNVESKGNYQFLGCDAVQSGREVSMFQ